MIEIKFERETFHYVGHMKRHAINVTFVRSFFNEIKIINDLNNESSKPEKDPQAYRLNCSTPRLYI